MKFIVEISDEKARTGEIIEECRGCEHALLAEGNNVENGEILFCTKFFEFPVTFKRVVHIPGRVNNPPLKRRAFHGGDGMLEKRARYGYSVRFRCQLHPAKA